MIGMKTFEKKYQQAVKKAIKKSHALGLPVYQSKNGYIVAIYPGNREVRLQKVRENQVSIISRPHPSSSQAAS